MVSALGRPVSDAEVLQTSLTKTNPATTARIIKEQGQFADLHALIEIIEEWEGTSWMALGLPNPYALPTPAPTVALAPTPSTLGALAHGRTTARPGPPSRCGNCSS